MYLFGCFIFHRDIIKYTNIHAFDCGQYRYIYTAICKKNALFNLNMLLKLSFRLAKKKPQQQTNNKAE